MKMLTVLLATPAIVLAACAHAEPQDSKASPIAHPIDWMSGCWVHADGNTNEIWSPDEGGLMFGYSISRKDGKVTFFEDLRIEQRPDGAVYIAYPGGGTPTEFRETERTGVSISFENPDHDYPQKITYSANRVALIATISLVDDEKARSFSMYRCDAPDRADEN